MAVRSQTERIRYLLGLCSPAERERVEAEYFNDANAFEKMLAAEEDLIDAYARGELTDEERRRFEERFFKSPSGRERVQFARALTGVVAPPVEKRGWNPVRIAAAAAVIVVVVVLSWLVIDRRRMNSELRELRAQYVAMSEETDSLKLKADAERDRAAGITAELNDIRAQSEQPKPHNVGTTDKRRVSRPKVKNVAGMVASTQKLNLDQPINLQDATIGNSFEAKRITELPLEANNVVGLLNLQPGTTRGGYIAGGRSDQANITLDGVDVAAAQVAKALHWFNFQLRLDTPAQHTDYRVIIQNTNGRHITSLDWIEPLTPNQTTIETPVIKAADFPSGDYKLMLMGKEPDGSFVRVAEYSFKLLRN